MKLLRIFMCQDKQVATDNIESAIKMFKELGLTNITTISYGGVVHVAE